MAFQALASNPAALANLANAAAAFQSNAVSSSFGAKGMVLADAMQFRIAHYGNTKREAHEGGLAIDRFNATGTAVRLEQEGIPVVLYGQGFVSLSAPSKELERLVMSNGFHHGGRFE